jgi:cathepsin B
MTCVSNGIETKNDFTCNHTTGNITTSQENFCDVTTESNSHEETYIEFKKKLGYFGFTGPDDDHNGVQVLNVAAVPEADLPASYDYRKGDYAQCFPDNGSAVVRDQGACGSCWAFAAVSLVEAHACINAKKAGKSIDFLFPGGKRFEISVQQIMSCNSSNYGCEGGWMRTAYGAMSDPHGIMKETEYPYQCGGGDAKDHFEKADCVASDNWGAPCPGTKAQVPNKYWNAVALKGTEYLIENGESAIKTQFIQKGPLAMAFVVHNNFMTFWDGKDTTNGVTNKDVYQTTGGGEAGGHAVLVVAYGVTSEGMKYWTLQNSWNKTWGDRGFFHMQRGVNICDIESWTVSGIEVTVDGGDGGDDKIATTTIAPTTTKATTTAATTATTTTTTTSDAECKDNAEFRDQWGDSCQWYADYWYEGICDEYPDAKSNCQETCRLCNDEATTAPTTTTTTTTTATTTTTTTTSDAECKDNAEFRDQWGDSCQWYADYWYEGICDEYPDAKSNCQETCRLC